MSLPIRCATRDDLPDIQAVAQLAYAPYVAVMGQRPAPMDADYNQLILERKTWLPTDPKVDAFCVFYPMGSLMHLETVAVHPQAQGRGLGTGLVTACEAAAQAAGLIGVALYTNAKMEQNLRLYPRLGYQETDRRREAGFERVYFAKIWQTSAGDPLPGQGPSAKK